MSKPKPGQAVHHWLKYAEDMLTKGHPNEYAKEQIRELRLWRAAFKKMAGATLSEDSEGLGIMDSMRIAKAILKARAVEARRKS